MTKIFLSILLTLNLLTAFVQAQTCEITAVTAVALPCMGNYFSVSVDLEVENASSPGFTLAGNGVIYGTYLYSDLPVTVGPFLGMEEDTLEFIAWDVENATCQQFTTFPAVNCGPICSISNFELNFIGCQGLVSALVVFDFDYENPGGLVFDLLNEEGEIITTRFYSTLPATIPYFLVNGAAPIVLTVCDQENENCCQTFTLPAIDCNPNNCEIFNVTVDPECTGSNFLAHLDFGYDNPPSDSFEVTGNLNYGKFGYNELPITLGPLNGSTNIVWQFIVEDSESASCRDTAVLGIYHCPPPCNMFSLEAMALECNGNEAFALEIGLDWEGEGDSGFSVFSQTTYYGNYSYDDLPLVLPVYESNCLFVDQVSVCDNENPGCCATTPFETLLCCGCLIYNLSAIPLPCNAEQQVYVQIDFDYQNVSGDGFVVTGNSTNYGEFSYDDLPIQVGPFPGDGSQFFEFVITDLANALCFTAVELGFIDCPGICDLSGLTVDPGICTGNNTYDATIDFDYQGVSGIGFDLFINGDPYDSYSYDDLPLAIEDFPSSGTAFDTVIVCENDNNVCCDTLIFAAPDCACNIFDASVDVLDCFNGSSFTVSLEFFYANLPTNFVDVFLDGVPLGFYNVEDIPLIIEIPEGSGTGTLTVCANDLNNCCDEVTFGIIDCPDCIINELIAVPDDTCTSDSTYTLRLTYNGANILSDSVIVTGNGNFIGQYPTSTMPIVIENFEVYESNGTVITVCAVGAPDCCDVFEFETPYCGPPPCQIFELTAVTDTCTSDTTFVLHVQFIAQNLNVDSVIISANGIEQGQYQVVPNNNIFVIQNFPAYNTPNTLLTVCAVGAPDCCAEIEFVSPECGPPVCEISELHVEIGECTSDSTYALHVLFDFDDLPSDSVIITGNGNNLGHFHRQEGHIIIENFQVYETNQTTLTVCAVGDPGCCDTFEFLTPSCDGCHLFDLVADPGACTSDTTYNLFVNYNAFNLPSDSVTVTANEQFIGNYVNNVDGFTITDFPVFDGNITIITICAMGDLECCDEFEFETPDYCDPPECEINELFAEIGDCTSGSTFVLDIEFNSIDLPTDSVTIYANDINLGQYFDNPDFIRIENFPRVEGEFTILTVCATEDATCCDTFTFATPFCTDTCIIYDVSVNALDCNSDSSFAMVLNFQHQNLPGGGFDVYAGDGNIDLGFYTFDQLPIEIGNFPANTTGQYVVTICESDGTTCCTSFEFVGPDDCIPPVCDISNLEYSLTVCDSALNFFFVLDFDFANTGAGGFTVAGNNVVYGTFSYDNVPVEIGPFPTDSTIYEFLVADAENPACFEFIEPGVVQCDSTNAVTPVDFDSYFHIFNNGTIPGFYAKKDMVLSIYNASGNTIVYRHPLTSESIYVLNEVPAGLYIATLMYGEYIWPVKVIKTGY